MEKPLKKEIAGSLDRFMYKGVYIVFFLNSKYLILGKLVNKLYYISIMEYWGMFLTRIQILYILINRQNISEITLKNPGYPNVYVCLCVCAYKHMQFNFAKNIYA